MSLKSRLASMLGLASPPAEARAYDGVEHRYFSDDAGSACPPGLLVRLLGFEPAPAGLQYALSLYAGGTGVHDDLAIRCRCTGEQWQAMVERLHLKDWQALRGDPRWRVDFAWLMGLETGTDVTRLDCQAFIESRRRAFQDPAAGEPEIRFSADSDVNSWCAAWRTGGHANLLSFDQG